IDLYEHRSDAARLVDLYRRRVELCADGEEDLKFKLLVDWARHYEADISDHREAIECLVQALGVREKDEGVLRRLDALYTRERVWPKLPDNLRLQAEAAPDDGARRALRKRMASVYAAQLQDAQSALEAYRGVLEGGFDEESVAAIRSIGESRDELRGDAADALEPVLRAAGRHPELASALELRLRSQTDAPDRARTLRSLAEVSETALGDVEQE